MVDSADPSSPEQWHSNAWRGKSLAALFSAGLLLTVCSPIVENWRENPRDDFPLSYYPMFTRKRPDPYRISHAIGLDASGNRILLPDRFAGDGGFNQTRRQLNRMVRARNSDPEKLDAFCSFIASRVGQSKAAPYKQISTVQIVTSTYRLRDYFSQRNQAPLRVTVRASRPVERDVP